MIPIENVVGLLPLPVPGRVLRPTPRPRFVRNVRNASFPQVNLKKCHPAHGVTFYLRTDDLFTTPAATPILKKKVFADESLITLNYNFFDGGKAAPEIEPLDPALAVGKLVSFWPAVGSRVKLWRFPSSDALNGERGVVVKDRGLVKDRGVPCYRFDVKLVDCNTLCCNHPAYYLKPEP